MDPQTTPVPSTVVDADRAVRRVRSEGDFPDDNGETSPCRRPGRHIHHRSEGQGQWSGSSSPSPFTPMIPATLPTSPAVAHTPPTPTLQRPSPVFLRDNSRDIDMLGDIPEDIQIELARAARRRARRVPSGWWGKVLVFFGQIGPDARVRSKLMSFVWAFSFGLVQVSCAPVYPELKYLRLSRSSWLSRPYWRTQVNMKAQLLRVKQSGKHASGPLARGTQSGLSAISLLVHMLTGVGESKRKLAGSKHSPLPKPASSVDTISQKTDGKS